MVSVGKIEQTVPDQDGNVILLEGIFCTNWVLLGMCCISFQRIETWLKHPVLSTLKAIEANKLGAEDVAPRS